MSSSFLSTCSSADFEFYSATGMEAIAWSKGIWKFPKLLGSCLLVLGQNVEFPVISSTCSISLVLMLVYRADFLLRILYITFENGLSLVLSCLWVETSDVVYFSSSKVWLLSTLTYWSSIMSKFITCSYLSSQNCWIETVLGEESLSDFSVGFSTVSMHSTRLLIFSITSSLICRLLV